MWTGMDERTALAANLMEAFAATTGLSGDAPNRRYLWTDAFAVCNCLGLWRETGEDVWRERAADLVERVHRTLGRFREDDERTGWISGLSEAEGAERPTAGGLRIGKPEPERPPDEPLEPRLEWERDGQYFHYLTRWMHALHRAAAETGEMPRERQAEELAATAHRAFSYQTAPGEAMRMVWKKSIDLSRALVPSMGLHDPLDGLVTYLELDSAPEGLRGDADLAGPIEEAEEMCRGASWETDDPLGIGGLLIDAGRLAQLVFGRGLDRRDLLLRVIADARESMRGFERMGLLRQPAAYRLAFRELGLSIGLHAVDRARRVVPGSDDEIADGLDALLVRAPIAEEIESFWADARNRTGGTWTEHENINTVMLATSLAPDGYVSLSTA